MKIPEYCPFCGGELKIIEFRCLDCDSSVRGEFDRSDIPVSSEHWDFIRLFLRVRGNLKKMGEILNLSYPTVRSRLEETRRALGFKGEESDSSDVISELEMGHIGVKEALQRLEGKGGENNE